MKTKINKIKRTDYDRRIALAVVTSLKLRRITEALQAANCGSSTKCGVSWDHIGDERVSWWGAMGLTRGGKKKKKEERKGKIQSRKNKNKKRGLVL